MTTGYRHYNQQYDLELPWPRSGTTRVGTYGTIAWNGTDAITAQTPRASYPLRPVLTGLTTVARQELLEKYKDDVGRFKAALAARRAEKRAKARRRRNLPPQPYSKNQVSTTVAVYYQYKPWYSPYIIVGGGYRDPFEETTGDNIPGVPVEQEYKVIAKLRAKAYGSGFNPAVFTAEGRQAFQMIGDAAISINGALRSLKRGDLRGVARNLSVPVRDVRRAFSARKTLSGRWLELQYGWLPLVHDMADAGTWLAAAINGSEYGKTGKLTARRTFAVFESTPAQWLADNPSFEDGYFTRRVTVFQLQYIIYGLQKSPTMMPSLATLATVAWEKTPWSFIVDWVIPIGDYLEACRTASDLKGLVVRSLKANSVLLDPAYGSAGYYGSYGPLPAKEAFRFTRTVSEELSPPKPHKGMADDLTFLSWRRAANAVALLAQQGHLWKSIRHGLASRHRYTE